jgi:hypothetical protein
MRRRRARAVKPGKEPDGSIATCNGEAEGPPGSAHQAPRAHTVLQRPRRMTTSRSRTPPTIVRPHEEYVPYLPPKNLSQVSLLARHRTFVSK